MTDLGELINKIIESGFTLSTIVAAFVVFGNYQEKRRIHRMLYLIGERLGIEWKSSLHTNGFAIQLPRLLRKHSSFSLKDTNHLKLRRKKNMNQLLSKKFILAIVGVLIPVINTQFNIDLNLDDLIGIWTFLGIAIAAIAHVDSKQAASALNAVKVAVTADPNTTYKDMIKTVNVVHNAITSVLADLKKDDGSQAFRDAADAYTQLHNIVNDFRKPEPLPFIPSLPEKVIS